VGGAGNDNSSALFYPAAYPDVLAVAGTDITDTKVADSNFGSWVDVTAPGAAITTTFSCGTYGASSGTSLAAPFASGLAGLLFAQHPGWSPAQVRAQIVHTAHNIDTGNPSYAGQLGSGRIDAAQAVNTVGSTDLSVAGFTVNGLAGGTLPVSSTFTLAITLNNNWMPVSAVSGTLASGNPSVAVLDNSGTWVAIPAGQSASNSDDTFQLVVAPGAYGQTVPFTLTLSADGLPLTLAFSVTTDSSQVIVSGLLVTDTTWTTDHIYVADGYVGVASGVTLTIQPGTVIEFNDGSALLVNGTLIARGTPRAPIRFTSANPNPYPGIWGAYPSWHGASWNEGIFLGPDGSPAVYDGQGNYAGGSTISYAVVEYGRGIVAAGVGPLIEHNVFQFNNNTGGGSLLAVADTNAGASATIRQNRVVYNQGSLFFGLGHHFASLTYNLFADNQGALVFGPRSGDVVGFYSNTVVLNSGLAIDYGQVHIVHPETLPTLEANNLVTGAGAYALTVDLLDNSTQPVPNNFWGTTDTTAIDALIQDNHDVIYNGVADYQPFLTTPNPDAPAFLLDAVVSPTSPVGIERATFDLTFSRPMDPAVNPTVTFGRDAPYSDFAVVDNAQWISPTLWRGTYDISSAVPRDAYRLNVSSARGLDGIEMGADTRFGFSVNYAGQITDQTPPSTPSVFATGANGAPGTAQAVWHAEDANSPITHYRYAIGMSAGAAEVVNWTQINTSTVTRTGLGLVSGQPYWFNVQAQNQGGLWSPVGSSRFVAGLTIHQAAADFLASSTMGHVPLSVTFSNTSTGNFTSSLLSFGDGVTSTVTSPTHLFSTTGVFTVTLQVSGAGGTNTRTRSAYITVLDYRIYLPLVRR